MPIIATEASIQTEPGISKILKDLQLDGCEVIYNGWQEVLDFVGQSKLVTSMNRLGMDPLEYVYGKFVEEARSPVSGSHIQNLPERLSPDSTYYRLYGFPSVGEGEEIKEVIGALIYAHNADSTPLFFLVDFELSKTNEDFIYNRIVPDKRNRIFAQNRLDALSAFLERMKKQ